MAAVTSIKQSGIVRTRQDILRVKSTELETETLRRPPTINNYFSKAIHPDASKPYDLQYPSHNAIMIFETFLTLCTNNTKPLSELTTSQPNSKRTEG